MTLILVFFFSLQNPVPYSSNGVTVIAVSQLVQCYVPGTVSMVDINSKQTVKNLSESAVISLVTQLSVEL